MPFPKTQWSLVDLAARGEGDQRQRAALATLLHRYLPALRSHLVAARRIPADNVDDLLQGFVADELIARRVHSFAAAEDSSGAAEDHSAAVEGFSAAVEPPGATEEDSFAVVERCWRVTAAAEDIMPQAPRRREFVPAAAGPGRGARAAVDRLAPRRIIASAGTINGRGRSG